MKLKKIIDLCKKAGYFFLFSPVDGEQWLSDGKGAYPLGDAPTLDEDRICVLFDIPNKAREKMMFRVDAPPTSLCFDDVQSGEVLCEQGSLVLGSGKDGVIPYKTSQGIEFIDRKHLEPCDDGGQLEVYERISSAGTPYFAVKRGLSLVAVLLPYDIINEPFVESLKTLAKLCDVAWENKRFIEEEQMRLHGDDE